EWKDWFELNAGGSGDYRYLYQTAMSGTDRYVVKYDGALNTNAIATKRVPLLRLAEMNYIVAESYLGVDNPAAVTWLNKARATRNLSPLSTTLSAADILP